MSAVTALELIRVNLPQVMFDLVVMVTGEVVVVICKPLSDTADMYFSISNIIR